MKDTKNRIDECASAMAEAHNQYVKAYKKHLVPLVREFGYAHPRLAAPDYVVEGERKLKKTTASDWRQHIKSCHAKIQKEWRIQELEQELKQLRDN